MRGAGEDRARRRELGEAARVEDPDAVAQLEHQRQIVGDEQDGEAHRPAELRELLQDVALHDDVERRRGLVHDEQRRAEREGHRDHDALAHASGQRVRVGVPASRVDAHER